MVTILQSLVTSSAFMYTHHLRCVNSVFVIPVLGGTSTPGRFLGKNDGVTSRESRGGLSGT